jgi:Fur family ferric uptake transcriptional regulator
VRRGYCRRMGRTVPSGSDFEAELGHDWQAELRARGYRLTPQRQLVLEAVGTLGHSTPEEIATAVRRTASGVNISTVYRTLELLEDLGLVRHTHLGHGAPTYSIATHDDHVHLVCRDCGGVEEAPAELVSAAVERLSTEKGFSVDVGHFALFGRCRGCREQATHRSSLSGA